MFPINVKSLVKNGLWFVNFRSMIRLTFKMPFRGHRLFFIFEGRSYSYNDVYAQSVRYANFFQTLRQKKVQTKDMGETDRLAIGIYQENSPEYLFAVFGAGLSNSVLFAVNTGFRGKTLAGVVNQAKISMLLTDKIFLKEVESILPDLTLLTADDILITENTNETKKSGFKPLETVMTESEAVTIKTSPAPMDNTLPVLLIYTSGTTGMPKGVPCTHLKMIGAGAVVQSAVRLTGKDRGYVCTPLFHSNAWYIGILPAMLEGKLAV